MPTLFDGSTRNAVLPAVVGFASVIGQVLLLRELMVLFNGNEISVGIMLGSWLAWTAAGALLAGRLCTNPLKAPLQFGAVAILCGASLPLTIWLLRGARGFFTPIPGELLGPVPMLLVSVPALLVFCGFSGAMFALASGLYAQSRSMAQRLAIGYAYAFETAGSAFGGLLASLLLLRFLGAMQIAAVVCLVDFCTGIAVLFRLQPRKVLLAVALTFLSAFPIAGWLAPRIEAAAQQRFWAGWNVVASRESIYGRITVTEAGGMRGIYEDGSILANVPDPATAEESVHYALLEHPAPRNVLLIGGGVNGGIAEALRHPSLQRLDYIELDPALPSLYQQLFPSEFAVFSDPRVHTHEGDGRRFLQTSTRQFDVILVNVPGPETAQWNRFYTVEFFRVVRARLAPGGVVAIQLSASEDFVSPQRAEFLRCIRRTVEQVFPQVVILPGDPVHLFGAMRASVLTDSPEVLISRLKARELHTMYVAEDSIPFRLSEERVRQIRELMSPVETTPINYDFRPIAYYFSGVLWTSEFSAGYAGLLQGAARLSFSALWVSLVAASVLLLAGIYWRTSARGSARASAAWSALAGGYGLMTLQILLLFTFQCLYGYVYSAVAMMIGMFMAGIAVGTWVGIRRVRSDGPRRLLRFSVLIQVLAALVPLLLMLCLTLLAGGSQAAASGWIAPLVFAALAFVCGVPGGMQFPLAAEIYFGLQKHGAKASAAPVYALDLLGGCVGALVVSGFLIPLFGFWKAALLAALVTLPAALLAARAGFSRQAIEANEK